MHVRQFAAYVSTLHEPDALRGAAQALVGRRMLPAIRKTFLNNQQDNEEVDRIRNIAKAPHPDGVQFRYVTTAIMRFSDFDIVTSIAEPLHRRT